MKPSFNRYLQSSKKPRITYKAIEDEERDEDPFATPQQGEQQGEQQEGDPQQGDPQQGEQDAEGFDVPEMGSELDSQEEFDQDTDPNNSKVIRTVKGAHLVYKKPSTDGAFEELWIFPLDKAKDDITVRKAILAGTDIPSGEISSQDGKQSYVIWTVGNAQMIHITGLPN